MCDCSCASALRLDNNVCCWCLNFDVVVVIVSSVYAQCKCLVMNNYCFGINRFHAGCYQNSRHICSTFRGFMCCWLQHATLIFNRLMVNDCVRLCNESKLSRCFLCKRRKEQKTHNNINQIQTNTLTRAFK